MPPPDAQSRSVLPVAETLLVATIGGLAFAWVGFPAGLMSVAATAYLRLLHGWDPLSALLGASPGSLGQAMALSAEFGADIRGIAIVQTVRVLLITLGLPAGLALF